MDYLTAPHVRQRFGGISNMTLWRWLRDEQLAFPKPIVINRRRYFRADDVVAFERRTAALAKKLGAEEN